MKILKKAAAALLAIAMLLSMTACHVKDETAISVGDYKITSAMYSYYLVISDSEAKTLISESEDYDTTAKNFSYYNQKIDGKSYNDYVKDLAIEKCLIHLSLEKICDDKELKLDDETKQNAQSKAQYYWNYYYGPVLAMNGVGYQTYEKIMLNEAKYNLYFEHIYGEGGEKAVTDKEINTAFNEHYSASYMIVHDYSGEDKPDVDAISKDLQVYVDALNNGKAYADVLADYNKANDIKEDTESKEDANQSGDNKEESKEEEKPAPADSDIVILTDYEETYSGEAVLFDMYDDVKKLAKDKATLLHDEDNKCYYIVVKKDITQDSYYLDSLKEEILYLLKTDEFDKFLDETSSKLEYEVSKYAVNQFKVKNIYDGTEA